MRGGEAKRVTALEHPVRWKIGWAPEGDIHDHSKSFLNPPAARIDLGFIQQGGRWQELMKKAGASRCYLLSDLHWHVFQSLFVFIAFLQFQKSSPLLHSRAVTSHNVYYVSTSQPWLANTALFQVCAKKRLLVLVQIYVLLFAFFFPLENEAIMLKCNQCRFLLFWYFIFAPAVHAFYLCSTSSLLWN